MGPDEGITNDSTLLERLERLDVALVRFEAAWRAGASPRIETYLEGAEGPERTLLLRELIALELELARGAAQTLDPVEYRRRFAGDSLLVDQVFQDAPRRGQRRAAGGAGVLTSSDEVVSPCEGSDASLAPCTGEGAAIGAPASDERGSEKSDADIRKLPPGERSAPTADLDGAEPRHELADTRSLLKSTSGDRQFGRYRLLRVLGQGAFGRVYLAFDEELQRQVAIKVPTPDRFQKPGDAERYLAEARIVATLDHPNIVPVYDVGRTADGSVYVVSKFIEGRTLADRIEEQRPSAGEASRLVATVARALDHAHRKRLIHRDVKPANILLEEASNTPYVADFGLAISEEASLAERNIAGTPAYMSPEQVRGEGHRLDGRSDIFSLGVVLYELLTGKKPFRGSTMMEVFHQVISDDPLVPRALDDSIPAELERICLKALCKRASDRYTTAAELVDDLLHWQQGPQQVNKPVTIVPRGLRSFGPDDADFFLDLLPGTRGRDGLPESIRFWKTRIEEPDPDKTFDVGLIYGPSGCGKSSLVKAGLLPHLSKSIVAVYVEATGEETESRILRALRKRLPELSDDQGLVETFTAVRRGGGPTGGGKVVIVMDQFEQWLHARRGEQETELVNALRQCDGANLQAVVMVRDDFSMAASRFMRALESPILEGHNFATVDLFDLNHAVKVLTQFGQAFGRLSDQPGNLSDAEQAFIRSAATGLAQDGKVVSVRLALFAEMVKHKPWVPSTLDEVGGTEGIGVTFLEEIFSSSKANPEHRLHQQAARQVLKALLPEVGTDIKGHMRSHVELLAASGYQDSAGEFRELLRILDGVLRLITPTDPEGFRSGSGSDPSSKYYQLTHDYLVPSLREWLTRKQKETRQGRAELRLAELAALWSAKRENRRLPGWHDYRNIRRFTARKGWTKPQHSMMRQAARYHAQTQVRRLLEADLAEVPRIVAQVCQLRKFTSPLLRREQQAAADQSKVKLHSALALQAMGESQLDYLYEQLLQASASDFPVLRDALAGHCAKLSETLWKDAASRQSDDRRLRAAAALAAYEPGHPRWRDIREHAARLLTLVKPEYLGDWKEALRPVRAELLVPLSAIFRDREVGELQRALATSTLADYGADDVELLKDLIADADPQQFAELFPVLVRHGESAISALEGEIDHEIAPDWADSPTDPAWPELSAELRHVLEAAGGTIGERFLVCQGLPYSRVAEVLEQLRGCGHRPRCIRPYAVGGELLVAAAWTRDDRPWQWLGQSDVKELHARDADLRKQGFVPIDVSLSLGPAGTPAHYTAVWEQGSTTDTEVCLIAGPLGEPEQHAMAALVEEKFNCLSGQVVLDDQGTPHGASLWTRRKDQQKSTTRLFHDLSEQFREDDCPGLLLTDARLTWSEDEGRHSPVLVTTALWNVSTRFESRVLHGLSLTEQRLRGAQLAADGFRPVAISAVGGPDDGLPLAATVWHRPLVPEEVKDRLARRQANAAAALLRLDRERKVWPILQHRPDPRARSYLIHRMSPLDAHPNRVLDQLATQQDASVRRALILVLGEFSERQLPLSRRDEEIPGLLDIYANDPDPGIHGAVAWTLRHWGRRDDLSRIDREFATGSPVGDRRWFVNRQQQTLSVIQAPGEILIGSPPYEAGREGGPEGDVEMQRYLRIDHTFAIMTCEVTVAEFLDCRRDFYYRQTFSRGPNCPINNVTWYDGAAYCNWLNEREAIPREEWCYLPNERGEYDEGMRIVADSLMRTGYRLPTDAEWEFACRAGSITSRYYGQSADLDNHYAWTAQNALGTGTAPVGTFKPNDLGLFDMLGNVVEWVQDVFHEPLQATDEPPSSSLASAEIVTNQGLRAQRPSNYAWHSGDNARSAECGMFLVPNGRIPNTGFRVSRTCAPSDAVVSSEVRNDKLRVCRGVSFVHNTTPVRTSYRVRYSPNLGMIPWGIRTARTMP
jgi:serine/threonine protein kinase/formylglycine-generating enzyme required for sulfatase activity